MVNNKKEFGLRPSRASKQITQVLIEERITREIQAKKKKRLTNQERVAVVSII